MKIDIYRSNKSASKYLSVPAGTDLNTLKLPLNIDPDLMTLSPFKTSMDINEDTNRVALDARQVLLDISRNGYAIHGAVIEIRLSIG